MDEGVLEAFTTTLDGFGKSHGGSPSVLAAKLFYEFIDEFLGSAAGDVLLADGVSHVLSETGRTLK